MEHIQRVRFAIAFACLLGMADNLARRSEADEVGLVTQKPDNGRYVQVGDQFMIPYFESIPGTDVRFEMIPVSGGVFTLGSPPTEQGRNQDEGPTIRVRVEPMWVAAHEVSQEEYREFELLFEVFLEMELSDQTGQKRNSDGLVSDEQIVDAVTAPTPLYSSESTYEYGDGPKFPAVSMTQYAAQQYSKWLSILTKRQYRLPSEAEWEYACRGGTDARFSWGNGIGPGETYAWFYGNTIEGFEQTGSKRPNPFGLFDMHGNVGEWTVNEYTPDGYKWLEPLRRSGNAIPALDTIRWPKRVTSCVVRGGRWDDTLDRLRSSARMESDDEQWNDGDANFISSPWWYTSDPARSIGFRIVRSLRPLDEQVMRKFWDHTAKEVRENVQATLEMGRGRIGVLSPNLLPAYYENREKVKAFEEEVKERRMLQQRRPERPKPE